MYCGCINSHKNLQVQTHLYVLSHQPCHLHIHPRSRSPTTTAHPRPPLPIRVHHPHPLPSTSRIRYVFFSFLLFVLFFFTGRICPPSVSARIAMHPRTPSGKYIFFFFVYTHPRLQATHQPANTSARIRTGKSRQHGRTQRICICRKRISKPTCPHATQHATHPRPGKYFFVFVYTHLCLQVTHQQANTSACNTARNASALSVPASTIPIPSDR